MDSSPIFPESTNLAVHTPEDLVAVAAELKGRPRETLGWANPAEATQRLPSEPSHVATTPEKGRALRLPAMPVAGWLANWD